MSDVLTQMKELIDKVKAHPRAVHTLEPRRLGVLKKWTLYGIIVSEAHSYKDGHI